MGGGCWGGCYVPPGTESPIVPIPDSKSRSCTGHLYSSRPSYGPATLPPLPNLERPELIARQTGSPTAGDSQA